MGSMDEDDRARTVIAPGERSLRQYLRPLEAIRDLWRHRHLVGRFTQRDVVVRYKGSILGMVWAVIQPLCMLAVYTFVFTVIFGRGMPGGSRTERALALFCGLVIFNLLAECIARAPTLITSNANYVKKVVFPLQILPVSVLGSALFFAAISTVLLLAAVGVFMHTFSATIIAFPLVILPLVFLGLGLAWFLGALGVFLRDIGPLISVFIQMLFFLSPVVYPLSWVPESMRPIMRLNPLAVVIEASRQTLMYGQWPDWRWVGGVLLVSLVVAQFGYAWFMKMRRGFADVI